MKSIIYSKHLLIRMKARNFPQEFPLIIYFSPERIFFDVAEKRKIAVRKLKYKDKLRNIMIAFEEKEESVNIITIHPISEDKIINRIKSGRWTK